MPFVLVDNDTYIVSEPKTATKGLLNGPKHQRVCGLTKHLIEEGDSIVVISSNHHSFPDKFVFTKAYNELGAKESIRKIKKSFEEYSEIKAQINKKYFEWELK